MCAPSAPTSPAHASPSSSLGPHPRPSSLWAGACARSWLEPAIVLDYLGNLLRDVVCWRQTRYALSQPQLQPLHIHPRPHNLCIVSSGEVRTVGRAALGLTQACASPRRGSVPSPNPKPRPHPHPHPGGAACRRRADWDRVLTAHPRWLVRSMARSQGDPPLMSPAFPCPSQVALPTLALTAHLLPLALALAQATSAASHGLPASAAPQLRHCCALTADPAASPTAKLATGDNSSHAQFPASIEAV